MMNKCQGQLVLWQAAVIIRTKSGQTEKESLQLICFLYFSRRNGKVTQTPMVNFHAIRILNLPSLFLVGDLILDLEHRGIAQRRCLESLHRFNAIRKEQSCVLIW